MNAMSVILSFQIKIKTELKSSCENLDKARITLTFTFLKEISISARAAMVAYKNASCLLLLLLLKLQDSRY